MLPPLIERFDQSEEHGDGHPYDEACFLSYHGNEQGARLWAAAEPRSFRLGSTSIDLHNVANRAEVVLRAAEGGVLAMVLRNVDGAHGRHLLASAGIRLEASSVHPGTSRAMAGPNRTSSLTTGSTASNDIFQTLFNEPDVRGLPDALQLARAVMSVVEFREFRQAQTKKVHARHKEKDPSEQTPLPKSLIFAEHSAKLECALRVHAFPSKDPAGAPPARVGHMNYGQGPNDFNEFRQADDREGGRIHGHVDQNGTDGVALLNLGACDFFFDIGKGTDKCKCLAQKTKESWCIGHHSGHWVTRDDAPSDRYDRYLLRDRLCAACAAGGQGEECHRCTSGTVRLRSGDLVIFSGCAAFHGVSRVVDEQPKPLHGAHTYHLLFTTCYSYMIGLLLYLIPTKPYLLLTTYYLLLTTTTYYL